MPFIQSVKPPAQDTVQFRLGQFSGGLNNVVSPFELKPDESPNLKNIICFDEGSIETRPGVFKYLTEQMSAEIRKIFVYETGSFSYFLVCSDTKLYRIATTGGTITELLTVNDVISGFQFENKFYFVDGLKYREYDGTNIYEISQPSTYVETATAGGVATITFPAGASAVNDYYNNWTIYISSGTGSGQTRTISDYDGTTKVATVSVNWTTQPTNTSVFYVTSYAQGATYTDSVAYKKYYVPSYQEYADALKGLNNISDIVSCKYIMNHKSRIWFTNHTTYSNNVYYTDIDNVYYIPTNQWTPAVTNDADIIQGIYSFNDVLIIFKKNTIFALYGMAADDFELKEVTVSCGTISIDTVSKADNYLFYLGTNGTVYSLYDVRTDYRKMLTKSISNSLNLDSAPIDLHDTDWEDSRGIYYDQHYFLSIKDKVLVYSNGAWVMWDNLNVNTFAKYNNVLLLTNSDKYILRMPLKRFYISETFTATAGQTTFTVRKGYIEDTASNFTCKKNNTPVTCEKTSNTTFAMSACTGGETIVVQYLSMLCYNDLGTDYDSYWESKEFDLNYPSKMKQIRKLFLTAHTYKYFSSTISFDIYVDYYELNIGFTMKNQITLWGVALFGDKFINKNISDSKPIPVNKRGKIFRLRVSTDTKDQPFKLYNIYGEIVIRK